MKLQVTFKTPDAVDLALEQAKKSLNKPERMSDDEWDELRDDKIFAIQKILDQWITYGEYVTIEFDPIAQTAIVVKKTR